MAKRGLRDIHGPISVAIPPEDDALVELDRLPGGIEDPEYLDARFLGDEGLDGPEALHEDVSGEAGDVGTDRHSLEEIGVVHEKEPGEVLAHCEGACGVSMVFGDI